MIGPRGHPPLLLLGSLTLASAVVSTARGTGDPEPPVAHGEAYTTAAPPDKTRVLLWPDDHTITDISFALAVQAYALEAPPWPGRGRHSAGWVDPLDLKITKPARKAPHQQQPHARYRKRESRLR